MILFERSRVRLRMALVLALALAAVVGVIPAGAYAAVLAQAGTVEILFTPGDPVDHRVEFKTRSVPRGCAVSDADA